MNIFIGLEYLLKYFIISFISKFTISLRLFIPTGSIWHNFHFVFGYDLNRTCEDIRKTYQFDETCQGSVPESIIAFLESSDYESAIRLTISLGGDADTMGAITGGIAEAYYQEIPSYIKEEVMKRLPSEFITVMKQFHKKYVGKTNT